MTKNAAAHLVCLCNISLDDVHTLVNQHPGLFQ